VVGIAVQGMFLNTLLIIAVCATSMMGYALLFVIGVKPWWSAQYLIPILVSAQLQHHSAGCCRSKVVPYLYMVNA